MMRKQTQLMAEAHQHMPQGVAESGDEYELVRFREMIREASSDE